MPVIINGKSVGSINNTLERHEESIDTIDRGKVDADNLMLLDVISGLVLTQPVTTYRYHADVRCVRNGRVSQSKLAIDSYKM
jgi:hypothetical protein